MSLKSRLDNLERGVPGVRCVYCGHAPGDTVSPPWVEVEGDPDSPENVAKVDAVRINGCSICGWGNKVSVLVVHYDERAHDHAIEGEC